MGRFLADNWAWLAWIVVPLLAIVGREFVHFITRQADIRGHPDPVERLQLLKAVQMKRKEGLNYDQCRQFLIREGLRKGVAEMLLLDAVYDQQPDLSATNTLTWNALTCQYPGNWKESLADQTAPREVAIVLSGLIGAGCAFVRKPEHSSDTDFFQAFVEKARGQMLDATELPVSAWGTLEGNGIKLRGTLVPFRIPSEVQVFRPSRVSFPFLVSQYYAFEDEAMVTPALELIASTVRLAPECELQTQEP